MDKIQIKGNIFMCGIFGYIGKKAVEKSVEGIKELEYRGYDSAGVAFVEKSCNFEKIEEKFQKNIRKGAKNLVSIREKGEISCLEEVLQGLKIKSEIAIAHTRWATHGQPSIENCHPHFSQDGMWGIVHNGIIENAEELKKSLSNIKFESETDSEVAVQLFQKYFDGNVLSTIAEVCKKLKGSFAFAIIYAAEPEKIYFARKNSPVAVAFDKKCGVICSDLNTIGNFPNLFLVKNECLGYVEKGNAAFFDFQLNNVIGEKINIEKVEKEEKEKSYPHFMIKEIEEIPNSLRKTLEKYQSVSEFDGVFKAFDLKSVEEFLIIGCGTAFHAGMVGGRVIEEECKKKVCVEIASEFLHKEFLYSKNTLAIFVSQSGETADTLKAVKLCKEHGLKTLAITNVKNSSICSEVDFVLYTSAGKEVAVASTKAYNCQLCVFYLLSAYIKSLLFEKDFVQNEKKNIKKICNQMEKLQIDGLCREIADNIKDSKSIYMIGRGFDHLLSLEAALKLKEISYIHCEAMAAGELKHGTISLIENGTFVFAFGLGNYANKTLSNVSEVISRGGKVILFSQKEESNECYKHIKTEKIEEKYIPLYAVVYMQKVAYYTSVALGYNPDKPRSLAKSVTVE